MTLLRQQDLSRVELANKTGLVKSALTKITQQLIQEGLIQEFEHTDSDGRHGRPLTRLRLKAGIHYSICFYISIEGLQAFLIDQTNRVYDQFQEVWNVDMDASGLFEANALISKIINIINALKSKFNIKALEIITIATQGKIAQHSGIIHHSQILRETNFPFAKILSEQIDVPVQLFNIAFCSTFQLTQRSPATPHFIGLYLGYGLGVGVAINQKIILGPDGTSPEVSHMTYEHGGRPCHCGALGCTETYVTYQSIFSNLQESGISLPQTSIEEKFDYIASLLDEGNQICLRTMKQVANVIAHTMIQTMNIFDVQVIILNGETTRLFSFFKETITDYFIQHNPRVNRSDSIKILHEEDNKIAFQGLIELTNLSYQV